MTQNQNRERFFEIHKNRLDKTPYEKITDSEILMCFNGSGNRLQKASTISNMLDVNTSTARRRLYELEDEGIVYSEEVGMTIIFTLQHFFAVPYSDRTLRYLEKKIDDD